MRIPRKRKRLLEADPEHQELIGAEQTGFRLIRDLRTCLRENSRFHPYCRSKIMRFLIEVRQLLDQYPQLEAILHDRWFPVEQKARKFISDNLRLFEQEQLNPRSKEFPHFFDFASMMYRSSLDQPMGVQLQRAYFKYKISGYYDFACQRLELY